MTKKVYIKGLHTGGIQQKLTPAEEEVYRLLTIDFLTPSQIGIRRQTTRQATNKIINKLKKKGVINNALMMVDKSRSTPPAQAIRLHAQEFNIQILYKDKRYNEAMNKANTIIIDNNTVRLYNNSLEIYGGHSFIAEDVQKATAKSFDYWNRFFRRLESDLKVILIKSRSQNIRLVNSHYSEINNELAKDYEVKEEKLKVYTTEEGKLWFLIDNSFNLHEAETVHPISSKPDMQAVKAHFNDIRDNKPPTLSEIMLIFRTAAETNKETAAGLNAVVNLLKGNKDNENKDYFG